MITNGFAYELPQPIRDRIGDFSAEKLMLIVKDICAKYGLPEDVVVEEIERTFSLVLTNRFAFDVDAHISDNNIELNGYTSDVVKINPKNIKKPLIREIKYALANNLLCKTVYNKYFTIKPMIKKVIIGEIIRKASNGDIYVLGLDEKHSLRAIKKNGNLDVVAVCKMAAQPPNERGWYKEGMRLPFYVNNVEAIFEKGIPCLRVSLSRNSKGLTEQLLKKSITNRGLNIEVKCTRRIAGAISFISSSQAIPKDCIKEVSSELKERIKVIYAKR